ncbi:MAG: PDZ domain-containing protein [Bacteroidetes bacterium]|nr:PDZ domain-containing protein [Bacteroidota bacterium]
MKKSIIILTILFSIVCSSYAQTNESRLMRFPCIYANQVVFSYAGDLYTVAKTGGMARKLTNDAGYEMFAKFSPDGKNIAFTAQYDGNTEVYMMPSEGGIPKRLTITATLTRDDISDRMGPNNIVMGWKDNQNVIYRSRKQTFNDFKGQLFLANTNGGLSEELPFPCGGFCSYSPDKTKLAYNRVFREFRTWKYYKGGMADDIWIYDFKTKKVENITSNNAQDIQPMWIGENIYFISDRDRIMNLFVYNISSKQTKKLTQFTDYDIKFPSASQDAIIFEQAGYIYVFDVKTEKTEKITIRIADDFVTGRNQLKDASRNIGSSSVSPDGKRIALGARGDIWTLPAKTGITKNLTQTSGVHERNVAWSPDGKNIAYISDASGEDEIYIQKQDGSEKAIQITKNADTYKYRIDWSPDSKKIMWADKMNRIQYVDIDSKDVIVIDQSKDGEFNDYTWSADSKWIAYSKPDKSSATKIYLYETTSKSKSPVTDGWYDCGNPNFSSDGKYLFFTSNRDFNPTYSWTEWNHVYTDMTKVYFLTLAKETKSPFEPVNDDVAIKKEEKKADKSDTKDKKEETPKPEAMKVDFDGIIGRIVALPVEAAQYWNITAIDDNVYYQKFSKSDKKAYLMLYNLKDQKETNLGDMGGYEITADNKKMFINMNGRMGIIDLPKSKPELKDAIDLNNMKVWVDLKAEWAQIFNESWRQMEYFFYDKNMHGVDWKSINKKYSPLLPYINNRNDLNYIIGEMIGELNIGHAYVGGGDKKEADRINLGLLGARLSKDASGFYKIDKILKGENWEGAHRSPLTEIGVNVKEGDYIMAVNGKSVKDVSDIYELLINTANKQLELTVNSTASESTAHKVIVIPTYSEAGLYYYNWVQNNIEKVDKASNSQIGYIHIPDMGVEGLNEFVKHFYPQLSKKALIIDDRGNGGGNVSPMIIERLNRELVLMRVSRNNDPQGGRLAMQYGPKVILIDQYSASDGDLFPYQFKTMKIGKAIGVRTWGGVVGIRGSLPFIDGGTLSKPEFAHYDAQGKEFIIEGRGVEPDIKVENDPAKEYNGIDEQLDKAIEVILEELKNNPKELPPVPPYPDKTK